ncbi:hypothetical protein GCM10011491_41940 [Brucella endophytica]|uniref:DEAD/DEAH box helicase n=1 Tax=Brucella endophytica TaxID=1963359 RepID=A0A916SP31_9HYPH|nr:DEAD/DEAH box helicase [Brucella endophytica]GGB09622.1 hypothetical protein GCM10011491_41940 [Brucella endophytica]
MFDPVTAEFVRSAAPLPGLDPANLVDELTAAYVDIAATRLAMGTDNPQLQNLSQLADRMSRLADAYEAEIVLDVQSARRRSIAFVAASARQVLAQISRLLASADAPTALNDRMVGAELSASLLFLIAQRSSDAYEASREISAAREPNAIRRALILAIGRFARGQFRSLLEIDAEQEALDTSNPTDLAADLLFRELLRALQVLASVGLGETGLEGIENALASFRQVQKFAIEETTAAGPIENFSATSVFAGPYHLAALLERTASSFGQDVLVLTPSPSGADQASWGEWLKSEAGRWPFLWENHRDAIATGYLDQGNSLVMTTPTGSGKTTLAALKIAATLATGKTVLYLAPTHALVGQVQNDLNERVVGLAKAESIEDVGVEATAESLPDIAVATPERCFALLTFAPELFKNVGLLVFDEFHLLGVNLSDAGVEHTRIDRRSIDAMLCLLTFQSINSGADYLLLSAMVSNGQEVADWLQSIVGRSVKAFDYKWKPTRQLRSCVLYDKAEITDQKQSLRGDPPNKRPAARPYGMFSLSSGWHPDAPDRLLLRPLTPDPVPLGYGSSRAGPYLTSNRYEVAATIAKRFADSGLKVIVFCESIVTCGSVANALNKKSEAFESERDDTQNEFRETAVKELGSEAALYDAGTMIAAVHHGELLPTERRLVEGLFRRRDSQLKVLAATSTLAQGLNLPCDVVILASMDRLDESDPEEKRRSNLEPHEILNALGRAGRAGQAATGYSIVIPGQPTWCDLTTKYVEYDGDLQLVFADGDQCLPLADPLTVLFDIIETRGVAGSDADYLLRRLAVSLGEEREGIETFEKLSKRTFGYFQRRLKGVAEADAWLEKRKATLTKHLSENAEQDGLPWQEELAAKTGASPSFIGKLVKAYETAPADALEASTWIDWMLAQLSADDVDTDFFLRPDAMGRVFGRAFTAQKSLPDQRTIGIEGTRLALQCWFAGDTLEKMEADIAAFVAAHEGIVARPTKADKKAKRARRLVLRVAPDMGFLCGVLSQVAQKLTAETEKTVSPMLGFLPQLVRQGFNNPYQLALAVDAGHSSRLATIEHYSTLSSEITRVATDEWDTIRDKVENARIKEMFSVDAADFEEIIALLQDKKE